MGNPVFTCITGGEESMMVFLKPSPSIYVYMYYVYLYNWRRSEHDGILETISVYICIYVYLYNWRRREHDGILETISGTLDKKSNGSPSSMDSMVEMVSTLDLNMMNMTNCKLLSMSKV